MIVDKKKKATHRPCRRCGGSVHVRKRICHCGFPFSRRRNDG